MICIGNEFQLDDGSYLRIVDINEEGDILVEVYKIHNNNCQDIISYDYVSEKTIMSLIGETEGAR